MNAYKIIKYMNIKDFKQNKPLAEFTSYKIGGPAKYFYCAETSDSAVEAITLARKENIPYVILSGGTNLLISDKGFDGLVVRMENDQLTIAGTKVTAEAATSMAVMASKTVTAGLTGFEWGVGIPGKVGGAIYGNAGCFGKDIAASLKRVRVLYEQEDVVWMDASKCQFGYRDSLFKKHKEWIILEAEFELEKGDPSEGRKKIKEYVYYRTEKQPHGTATAGSTFTNPNVDTISDELKKEAEELGIVRNNTVPAGWLIDKTSLKGKQIGGVKVSKKHANFFENTGNGTAEEMMQLMSFVKQQVRDELGVQLHEEVQLLGF